MKIYHTETQADYDALMVELEEQGCEWLSGRKPTSLDYWKQYGEKTGIEVGGSGLISKGVIEYLEEVNPQAEVIKYKAKADEKMRFTKENVYKLFIQYRKVGNYTFNDLQDEILNLDDAPEKVVVPKFVADFYEECENAALEFLITQLEATYSRGELGEWYRSCRGRHRNGRANAQEVIAKMKLYGYEVEKEPMYYIPLPHLKTSDGIQQVLSKRKNDKNYFASRPDKNLKQRYTKDELAQVPEIYKIYAMLIEEEDE